MNSIISLGSFSGSFSGSGTVEASHALSPALDLSELRKLRLVIETTGAHKNIRVRLENSASIYCEFDMGGNREGAGESSTIEQTLEATIKNASYVTSGDDFDASDISNIRILFTDDGNITGTASADETKISLEWTTVATPTLQVVRGFKTELAENVSASSTQVLLQDTPYDKSTLQPLDEFPMILGDDQEINLVNSSDEILSKTYGEWFWLERVSTSPNGCLCDIIQRGGADPKYPPRLCDFRHSLRKETHERYSSAIMALDGGLIDKMIAEVEAMNADEKEKTLIQQVWTYGDEVTLGDHRLYIPITEKYDSHNLVSVWAEVLQEGTTGDNEIGLSRVRKEASIGGSDTQFDITNPSGTTFRYTYDTTGTDPVIADSDTSLRVGDILDIRAQNFSAGNNGYHTITAVGANYFEVDNASGVVESDKTIGTGTITPTKVRSMLSTNITIETGERESRTSATAPVIDTDFDDLQQYDKIRVDIKGVSTTKAKGLILAMQLQAQ